MIRSWMHIVNELSRALSQIDCDTVFTCGTLHDACVRDERKNEMLAAQYATRPEELASTLKSQIGFTISQDIVDMILKEALNSEREEDEEKMEEDEEKMEDGEEKMVKRRWMSRKTLYEKRTRWMSRRILYEKRTRRML